MSAVIRADNGDVVATFHFTADAKIAAQALADSFGAVLSVEDGPSIWVVRPQEN